MAAVVAGAVEVMTFPPKWDVSVGADLRRRLQALGRLSVRRRERLRRQVVRDPHPNGAGPHRRSLEGVVGLAASTGGPPALARVLAGLGGLERPVVIVQHLQSGFVDGFLGWMRRESALPVELAVDGAALRPGVGAGGTARAARLGPARSPHLPGRRAGHPPPALRRRALPQHGRALRGRRDRGDPHRHGGRRHLRPARPAPQWRGDDRPGRGHVGGVRDAQGGLRQRGRRPGGPPLGGRRRGAARGRHARCRHDQRDPARRRPSGRGAHRRPAPRPGSAIPARLLAPPHRGAAGGGRLRARGRDRRRGAGAPGRARRAHRAGDLLLPRPGSVRRLPPGRGAHPALPAHRLERRLRRGPRALQHRHGAGRERHRQLAGGGLRHLLAGAPAGPVGSLRRAAAGRARRGGAQPLPAPRRHRSGRWSPSCGRRSRSSATT